MDGINRGWWGDDDNRGVSRYRRVAINATELVGIGVWCGTNEGARHWLGISTWASSAVNRQGGVIRRDQGGFSTHYGWWGLVGPINVFNHIVFDAHDVGMRC